MFLKKELYVIIKKERKKRKKKKEKNYTLKSSNLRFKKNDCVQLP